MKTCSNCGQELTDDSLFCNKCGNEAEKDFRPDNKRTHGNSRGKSVAIFVLSIFTLALFIYIFALVQDNHKLQANIAACNNTIDSIKTTVDNLNSKINDLQNAPTNLYASAMDAEEKGDHESALVILESILEKYPESDKSNNIATRIEEIKKNIESQKEQEKLIAAEAAKSAQDKVKEIVRVKNITFDVNSAGGVSPYINWINNSDKTIKYITFTVSPYNAVGDKVLSHGKYDATSRLEDTGPYGKGEGNNAYWSLVWYNSTTKVIKLEKIEIEYMDGTAATISSEDIAYAQY